MSHNLDFRTWRINLRDIDAANLKQPPRRTFYLLQRGKEKKKKNLARFFWTSFVVHWLERMEERMAVLFLSGSFLRPRHTRKGPYNLKVWFTRSHRKGHSFHRALTTPHYPRILSLSLSLFIQWIKVRLLLKIFLRLQGENPTMNPSHAYFCSLCFLIQNVYLTNRI